MIPILYKTITEGVIPSDYGAGALFDCLGYTVEESRNGEYEMTLEYPANGLHVEDLAPLAIIKAKPNYTDDPQLFEIYKVGRVMGGRFTVNARHISYRLSNKVILSGSANSCAAACSLLQSAAGDFTITTDKQTAGAFSVYEPSSVRSWFGGKSGSLLDIYGAGEWYYDNFDAHLLQNRGQNRGAQIRYGKNLTQLSQEINIENLATAIIPWCKDENENVITGAKINTGLVIDSPREMAVDFTDSIDFESATPILTQLATAGAAYIANNNFTDPTDSITLDFVQLGDLAQRVDLCDTVSIFFEALGITATAKCIKTVWNGLEDRYESCTFGNPRVNIADTITAQQKDIDEIKGAGYVGESEMQTAINTATARITGNSGGYVINGHDTNGDGVPDENLIMDTDDITTATKVIRSNLGGIGFSTNGYAGPYRTAIGFSGIVADAITTGTLNADLIKAGVLQSANGASQIDMTSGVAKLYDLVAERQLRIVDENGNEQGYLSAALGGGSGLMLEMNSDLAVDSCVRLWSANGYGVLQLWDAAGNETVVLDGGTGKVICDKMSVRDVSSDYTVTGASGAMEIDPDNWEIRRTGSVVFMAINFKGKGQNVGAGSNAFVGTLNGPLPAIPSKMLAYYSGDVFILNIATDGAMTLRNCGAARSFTANQAITICGSFVTED